MHELKTSRSKARFLLMNIFEPSVSTEHFPQDFINRLTWKECSAILPQLSTNTNSNGHDNSSDDGDETDGQDDDPSVNHKKRKHHSINSSASNNDKDTKEDIEGNGGGNGGPVEMLHFGDDNDVANEMDLLDFIDDKEERNQIKIKFVLERLVPRIVWGDGTTGTTIHDLVDEDDISIFVPSKAVTSSSLSEQNLLQHNKANV